MKMSRFNKVSSLAVASALALGAAFYTPTASAKCLVVDGKTVGCGTAKVTQHVVFYPYPPYFSRYELVRGGSQDRLTDGWCVGQRLRRIGESWPGKLIPESTDCNATWNYYPPQKLGAHQTGGVRLYRADKGRYLQLLGR